MSEFTIHFWRLGGEGFTPWTGPVGNDVVEMVSWPMCRWNKRYRCVRRSHYDGVPRHHFPLPADRANPPSQTTRKSV